MILQEGLLLTSGGIALGYIFAAVLIPAALIACTFRRIAPRTSIP